MNPNLCMQCGAALRKYAKDVAPFGGADTGWARKGEWDRSVSINAMDPDGLFCTLRCAARYGVRAARAKVQP